MKKLLFLMLVLTLGTTGVYAEDSVRNISGFNVGHLSGEDADPAKRPFTITSIRQSGENFLLWISSPNIGEVSRLLNAGRFETQSTLGDLSSSPSLSLWKQVTCTDTQGRRWTREISYSTAAGCSVVSTQYYLRSPVTVSNGRNFGIALDPDYLWLIEKL